MNSHEPVVNWQQRFGELDCYLADSEPAFRFDVEAGLDELKAAAVFDVDAGFSRLESAVNSVIPDVAQHDSPGVAVEPALFARKLNALFGVAHPRDRGPYTTVEVCDALTASGHPMSSGYLTQLRRGRRMDPSEATVAALARLFGVKPEYFTNDIYRAKVDHDLTLLAQLQGDGLRRLSARAFDLSDESRALLTSMTEKFRAREGASETSRDQQEFGE